MEDFLGWLSMVVFVLTIACFLSIILEDIQDIWDEEEKIRRLKKAETRDGFYNFSREIISQLEKERRFRKRLRIFKEPFIFLQRFLMLRNLKG